MQNTYKRMIMTTRATDWQDVILKSEVPRKINYKAG